MYSIVDWPGVVEYEADDGEFGPYLTLRLRRGIRVRGHWTNSVTETVAPVWTVYADEVGFSSKYQGLVFGKEVDDIEEGDTATILVATTGSVEEALSKGLAKLLFQTVEVGDAVVN